MPDRGGSVVRMPRDPRIDTYIAAGPDFARPIPDRLRDRLRDRVHAACPEVEESIAWSMPAFSYRGRPLAAMAAFQRHAAFGFRNRSELATGRKGEARRGEAMGQYGRITAMADLPDAGVTEDRVRHATALIARGAPPKAARAPAAEAEVPDALTEALARDGVAAAAFDAFPARSPRRISRTDRRCQAPRDPRQARRRSARLASRGQTA